MKRTKKSSLLTGVAAVAGLAMGGSIAMAATHPPIQLFTYEEVATQMGFPAAPVMVRPDNKQGMPYSPKATCSGGGIQTGICHSDNTTAKHAATGKPVVGYSALAKHAFHSALGYNEWMDNSDSGLFVDENGIQTGLNPQKPWLQSHGHNGKW